MYTGPVDWESVMKQVLGIQKMLLGHVTHEVRVTKYGSGYSVRVFTNSVLNQEAHVDSRMEIGPCAKDLLRWEDKCGNMSDYASSARHRK
jgi:hypothetical protein